MSKIIDAIEKNNRQDNLLELSGSGAILAIDWQTFGYDKVEITATGNFDITATNEAFGKNREILIVVNHSGGPHSGTIDTTDMLLASDADTTEDVVLSVENGKTVSRLAGSPDAIGV